MIVNRDSNARRVHGHQEHRIVGDVPAATSTAHGDDVSDGRYVGGFCANKAYIIDSRGLVR